MNSLRTLGVMVLVLFLAVACASNQSRQGGSLGITPEAHTEPVPSLGSRALEAAAQPPGTWNTAATSGGPGFEIFRCEFTVPSVPVYKGQSIFLWCGVQQSSGITDTEDRSFGVLQPVLMFGPDCVHFISDEKSYESHPFWYYSAQYVYPNPVPRKKYKCTTGRIFTAQPGDVLLSSIRYNPLDDSMTVQVSRRDGSGASTLKVAHPWDKRQRSWREFIGKGFFKLEGALEVDHLDDVAMLPSELLTGWNLRASIVRLSPHPFTNDEQWQLKPHPDNLLSVECTHQTPSYESRCVWKEKP